MRGTGIITMAGLIPYYKEQEVKYLQDIKMGKRGTDNDRDNRG
jgi:hypothetical protein